MPKVLRIINRLNLGGPTYNAAYLSRYLSPDFETMLVAGIKEDTEESSEFIVKQMGLDPVYIPEMRREINISNDFKAYKKINELIRKFKPDIVHTHAAKAGTIGRLAALSNNVPIILHTFHGHVFHSYFNPVKTTLFKSIERYLAKKTTGIIAISEIQKTELCDQHKICLPEHAYVIPLGFDLSRFRENMDKKRADFRSELHANQEELLVGIIGRLVPIKNQSLFVEAVAKLRSEGIKFKAVVIGDGEDRQMLQQLSVQQGLKVSGPNVISNDYDIVFTSWILDIDRALAGLDIVAMTSLNEGTPVSLIEAQAAGKPIVTTNVGGIGNVILPGQTGLLSQSGDIEEFMSNLRNLILNQHLRSSLSEMGWEHVKTKFSYERLIKDMRDLYIHLLKDKGIFEGN